MSLNELDQYFKKNFHSTSSFLTGAFAFFIDIIVLLVCFGIGFFIVNLFATKDIEFRSFINYSIYFPIFMAIFLLLGLYPGIMISPEEEIKKYSMASLFSFSVIFLSISYSDLNEIPYIYYIISYTKEMQILFAFLIAFFFSVFLLPFFRDITKHLIKNTKWYGVPAVIYCTGDSGEPIIGKLLKYKNLGYKPCLILNSTCTEPTEYNGIPVFNPEDSEVIEYIRKKNIKNAVLCGYKGDVAPIMNFYRYTITIAKQQGNFTSTQHIKDIDGIIGFSSTHNLTFKTNLFLKRLLDILVILLFSPILVPVFLVLIILTKITSRGPVFYGHKRVGRNGKEFKCWKFRSMCTNSQEILEEILATDPVRKAEWEAERKFKDDPRVTKFGKILRKTSLDELPQLINIFIGQMSFVGPRPVTEPELEKYGTYKDYVLSVSPGLSGMWQVSGRSETNYEERINYDTYYIQNWSVWLDIWILIKTVSVVLVGKGAY